MSKFAPLEARSYFGTRMEIKLENGVSFQAYHSYKRWRDLPGYIIATIREVEDPTDEYDSLAEVPDDVWDNMDFIPQFYSMRIGITPVVVDYNGTLLIPDYYRNQLQGLSGEYRIANVYDY